ncbi:hypothetical protein Tco_0018208 [Tanacetum coccineum]
MTYPCHWYSEQVGLVGDLGSTNDVLIPLVRYFEDIDYFKDFKNEFLAIVYEDALTSESKDSSEPTVKMDDPNITIEEYIRLEEENAHRHAKVYNWETATRFEVEVVDWLKVDLRDFQECVGDSDRVISKEGSALKG